jgi:hypothetical protein
MSRPLIVIGLLLVLAGLFWDRLGAFRLGRLPGDIVIEHGNVTFYFPLASGILVSVALSLILWLIGR